jgi:hypothetical protein
MIQSIESLLTQVSRRWREQDVAVASGASLAELRSFEARFKVQCPADFAMYLLTLGGMPEGDWDEHLIRFWPLVEIRPLEGEPGVSTYSDYFIFADYSISAHEYGIRLSTSHVPEVALICGPAPKAVASSFTAFLAQYLSDPTSIHV